MKYNPQKNNFRTVEATGPPGPRCVKLGKKKPPKAEPTSPASAQLKPAKPELVQSAPVQPNVLNVATTTHGTVPTTAGTEPSPVGTLPSDPTQPGTLPVATAQVPTDPAISGLEPNVPGTLPTTMQVQESQVPPIETSQQVTNTIVAMETSELTSLTTTPVGSTSLETNQTSGDSSQADRRAETLGEKMAIESQNQTDTAVKSDPLSSNGSNSGALVATDIKGSGQSEDVKNLSSEIKEDSSNNVPQAAAKSDSDQLSTEQQQNISETKTTESVQSNNIKMDAPDSQKSEETKSETVTESGKPALTDSVDSLESKSEIKETKDTSQEVTKDNIESTNVETTTANLNNVDTIKSDSNQDRSVDNSSVKAGEEKLKSEEKVMDKLDSKPASSLNLISHAYDSDSESKTSDKDPKDLDSKDPSESQQVDADVVKDTVEGPRESKTESGAIVKDSAEPGSSAKAEGALESEGGDVGKESARTAAQSNVKVQNIDQDKDLVSVSLTGNSEQSGEMKETDQVSEKEESLAKATASTEGDTPSVGTSSEKIEGQPSADIQGPVGTIPVTAGNSAVTLTPELQRESPAVSDTTAETTPDVSQEVTSIPEGSQQDVAKPQEVAALREVTALQEIPLSEEIPAQPQAAQDMTLTQEMTPAEAVIPAQVVVTTSQEVMSPASAAVTPTVVTPAQEEEISQDAPRPSNQDEDVLVNISSNRRFRCTWCKKWFETMAQVG